MADKPKETKEQKAIRKAVKPTMKKEQAENPKGFGKKWGLGKPKK